MGVLIFFECRVYLVLSPTSYVQCTAAPFYVYVWICTVAEDSYQIGINAYNVQDYAHTRDWMKETLRSVLSLSLSVCVLLLGTVRLAKTIFSHFGLFLSDAASNSHK